MNPNMSILEYVQIHSGFPPIGLGSARTGDVVSLSKYRRCLVLFKKNIGTPGDDPTITIEQGTDVAFGTNKPLTWTTMYVKQDPTSLGDVGQWTKVTRAAASTYVDTTSAEQEAIWAIDFQAEDLDIELGYSCIRAKFADAGTATQIGDLVYLLYDPINSEAPEDMASGLTD